MFKYEQNKKSNSAMTPNKTIYHNYIIDLNPEAILYCINNQIYNFE